MATETDIVATSDTAILSRLIGPGEDTLSPEAAEALLEIRFRQADLDRIHELAVKNQEDRLTAGEQATLENYRRISFLVDLMHAKARLSLKKHRPVH